MHPHLKLFTPSILNDITKLLIPRAKTQVSYKTTGMTEIEADLYRQRAKLKASVLIPLCNYQNKPCILYTQRTERVSTHQNEISFPGGHADHSDESVLHSCLREFHEELGVNFSFRVQNQTIAKQLHTNIDSASAAADSGASTSIIKSQPFMSNSNEPGSNALDIEILGSLYSVPSKHGTSVQPIVGFLKLTKWHENNKSDLVYDVLKPHSDEVQHAFCVPIEELAQLRYQKKEQLERRGTVVRYIVPSTKPYGDIWGLTGFLTQQVVNHVIIQAFRLQQR